MTNVRPAPRIAVPERLDIGLLDGFDRAAQVVATGGETMGTRWHALLSLPSGRDPAPLTEAIAARLAGIVGEMSHWAPESLLCRFNRAEAGHWQPLPADFAAVMATALDVAARSDGAFDPAIGQLTDLWGLGPRRAAAAPDRAGLAQALAASGWRCLDFDPTGPRLRQPGGLWLDLSGIAKGFAVDAVADMLGAAGIRHALVEIGGELAGRGIRPDGEPWWVDLETPPGLATPPLRIALHELAVATSGDYLRGAHSIDPATGLPALHAHTAVSVLHPSCMVADAWASALAVLPPDAGQALAVREGLAVRMVFRDGGEWLSPALARML